MITSILIQKCADTLSINSIKIKKILSGEFKVFICMDTELTFKGSKRKTFSYVLPLNSKFYENLYPSGLENLIEVYNTNFANTVNEYNVESFGTFDKTLKNICEGIGTENENNALSALILSNAISFTTFFSQALFQNIEFAEYVKQSLMTITPSDTSKKVPNLGFTIFKCGKSMNSKCKFERFMIIINNSSKMAKEDLQNLISKIYASIRKILTAGKAGVK